eukprot:gnl/TRDRNA2_/TRDRNA2_170089_c0_seq1.p1 gnl/TRDRNA2_/TRDRNA2_170089_c0~~gnl/TRDRNA2_/TRDRNA2_170089_c0_seq1.p1  ORF type:complete len:690 (-),score=61.26 gnl/TRDRNA2_/TRDRNA2_170089_c0_seq1:187-2256(-)
MLLHLIHFRHLRLLHIHHHLLHPHHLLHLCLHLRLQHHLPLHHLPLHNHLHHPLPVLHHLPLLPLQLLLRKRHSRCVEREMPFFQNLYFDGHGFMMLTVNRLERPFTLPGIGDEQPQLKTFKDIQELQSYVATKKLVRHEGLSVFFHSGFKSLYPTLRSADKFGRPYGPSVLSIVRISDSCYRLDVQPGDVVEVKHAPGITSGRIRARVVSVDAKDVPRERRWEQEVDKDDWAQQLQRVRTRGFVDYDRRSAHLDDTITEVCCRECLAFAGHCGVGISAGDHCYIKSECPHGKKGCRRFYGGIVACVATEEMLKTFRSDLVTLQPLADNAPEGATITVPRSQLVGLLIKECQFEQVFEAHSYSHDGGRGFLHFSDLRDDAQSSDTLFMFDEVIMSLGAQGLAGDMGPSSWEFIGPFAKRERDRLEAALKASSAPTEWGKTFQAVRISAPLLQPAMMRDPMIGGDGQGAKNLVDMPRLCKAVSGKTPVVYGVGIAREFAFENDMATEKCEVHGFDCTVDAKDKQFDGIAWSFHPWCVGERASNQSMQGNRYIQELAGVFTDHVKMDKEFAEEASLQFKGLSEIMRTLGHTTVKLLKFDIEGFEWQGVFDELLRGEVLFEQLSFELHTEKANDLYVPPQNVKGRDYFAVNSLFLRLWDLGYRVVSIEVNEGDPGCAEIVMLNVNIMKERSR